nr:hypothetical protein [Tanacetum cinerariifolium]
MKSLSPQVVSAAKLPILNPNKFDLWKMWIEPYFLMTDYSLWEREFSIPRTPQQNEIAERKNRTLIEAARTMLADSLLPIPFWAEAVNTACYVQNKNTDDDVAFRGKKPEFEGRKPESEVHVSPSSKFEDFSDNNINKVNAADSPVPAVGQISTNSTNTFSVACPSNTAVSPTNGKSSYANTSQYPDDPNMPALEDITYYDDEEAVGAEADFTKLETTITVSSISTTRAHKDHPVTQIIGDLSLATQTRSMTRVDKDQGGLSQINNDDFHTFLWDEGIKREFSVPRTPQQNEIAERKNRTLIEAARTMLADLLLPIPFWAEAVNTACYVQNKNTDDDAAFRGKKPEFEGRKPESEVHVSPSSKFEDFSDNNINKVNAADSPVHAVGQISTNSTNTFSVAGPSNTAVSLTNGKSSYANTSQYPDDPNMPALEDITYYDDEEAVGAEADFTKLETTITVSSISTTRAHKDHHVTQIISDLSLATQTKSMTRVDKDQETKRIHQALKDPSWIEAIQEELLQFKMQKVWVLVDLPNGKRAIGFMVYQMYVKSAFLYGTIKEEVYVCQPLGFKDPDYPDKIYVDDIIFGSTNKDLCKAFEKLMKDKFQMSLMGELTFFLGLQVKQKPNWIFISQDKYVAEILRKFGLMYLLKDHDSEDVDVHTYRSMIGSLMYLTSSRPDIMFAVCACARFQVTPKASHLHAVKRIFRYLKFKPHLALWYLKDSPFNLVAYSDSDYAGASMDIMFTTEGCQFLGCRLISWQCKKQTVVATSYTEAEYVAAARFCAQVLWIQNQLLNYGPDQTVSGKDSLNLLMADNLLKIVWYSTHHVALMKSWLVQKQIALGQTTTGKENSNPFMA